MSWLCLVYECIHASLFEQFCPPKFPFLLWLKLLIYCTIESDRPADHWMKTMSTLFASPYKFGPRIAFWGPDLVIFWSLFWVPFWARFWGPRFCLIAGAESVCFWCFWMLFDPCLRKLMFWTYLVGVLLGYLWVWAEDVLFGEVGRNVFLKLENSFEVVWEVWERLSVTAFHSARFFYEEEWLSCQTCVVWLKSELWKKSCHALSCFHMVAEPQWSWGWETRLLW